MVANGFTNNGYKPEDIEIGFGDVHENGDAKLKSDVNGEPNEKPIDEQLEGKNEDQQNKIKRQRKFDKYVSIPQLFRYADGLDKLLMIVGSIAAVINGGIVPGQLSLFGELAGTFIEYGTNATAANEKFDIVDKMSLFAQIYTYLTLGGWISGYIQCACWSLAAIRQSHRIRIKFQQSIMRQNIGWFDVHETGGLTSQLFADITTIQTGIGDKVGTTIACIATFVGAIILSFVFGWKLTLVMISLTPIIGVSGALSARVMAAFSSKEQVAYAAAGSIAEEVISSIRTVVAFGGEKFEMERYKKNLVKAEKAGIKKGLTGGISMGVMTCVLNACSALAFWYGSKLVAEGDLDGGRMMSIFFAMLIGSIQLGQAGPNFEALATARGTAYTIYEIIEKNSPIDALSKEGVEADITNADEIKFQEVHFNYPSRPDIQVLNGFNLTIKRGSTIALVGQSGCGKSTVVKLLQRFYDVDQGQVLIGNENIRNINVRWLREHVGIVSQEPVLFDATIGQNIAHGKDDATEEEIEKAAKNANAHDFIMQLPKKYDTNVGEGGAQLSGGQKQRIAIARALIKNPAVLLLDEATSALDSESESIVQSALDKASVGRTTIIIAHRLSTVRNADVIIVVKKGKVVEQGKHDELMLQKGIYYQLVTVQSIAEKEVEKVANANLTEEELEAMLEDRVNMELSNVVKDDDEMESEREAMKMMMRQISRSESIRRTLKKKRAKKEKKSEENEEQKQLPIEPASFFQILKYNKPEAGHMLAGTLFAGIAGVRSIAIAFLIAEVIGSFSSDEDGIKDQTFKISMAFLGLGFVMLFANTFAAWLFAIAGEKLTTRLRTMAFESILKQDIAFFDDPLNGTGPLTSRLSIDASKVKGATSARLKLMVEVSFTAVAAVAVGFAYSWKLTLLVLAFVPFLLLGGILHAARFKNFAAKEGKRFSEASIIANEGIMNIRTIAALGKEQYIVDKFVTLITLPYRASKRQANIYALSYGFSRAIGLFANAASFYLGGYLVRDEGLEFQNVFKVVLIGTFGSMIAGQALSFTPDYLNAKVAAARLFKIFATESKIDATQDTGTKKENVSGNIEFNDVHFNYPSRPDVHVLQGLNISINPGDKVALVGASGSGKSTTVGLLERFYNPASGIIKLDGVEISSLNLKWLRSKFSVVSQEPVLFARSIKENIAYGLQGEDVPLEDIMKVAASANIHDFISSLPRGYDTMVGEKGTLISGGQKQRIAIARALIRNPKILLLDEATSALDSESEKIVQEALDNAMVNRTSMIIAHRLSTVQNADKIAVIQGGKVCEIGTHQELLSKRGVYYNLNMKQGYN